MKNINLKSLKKAILYSQVCISMACTQMQKNDMKGDNEIYNKNKKDNWYLYFLFTRTAIFNKVVDDLISKSAQFSVPRGEDYRNVTEKCKHHYPIMIQNWDRETMLKYIGDSKDRFDCRDNPNKPKPLLAIEVTHYLNIKSNQEKQEDKISLIEEVIAEVLKLKLTKPIREYYITEDNYNITLLIDDLWDSYLVHCFLRHKENGFLVPLFMNEEEFNKSCTFSTKRVKIL